MFSHISYLVIGQYFVPVAYTEKGTGKTIPISELISSGITPTGYGYEVMHIDDSPGIPEEISGLYVPILCEIRNNMLYPLMGESYIKYSVGYVNTEYIHNYAVMLAKLHHYIMTGKSILGDFTRYIVSYNDVYASFYNSYALSVQQAQQAQQAQEQVQEAQAQQEQVQEVQTSQEVKEEPKEEEQVSQEVKEVKEEPKEKEPKEEVQASQEVKEESKKEDTPASQEPKEELKPAKKTAKSAVKGFGVIKEEVTEEEEEDEMEASTTEINSSSKLFTNNSGQATVIVKADEAQLQAAKEALSGTPTVITNFDEVVPFVPTVLKYEKPLGTIDYVSFKEENPDSKYIGLSGVEFEDFEDILSRYDGLSDLEVKNHPNLLNFGKEIEEFFDNKITVRELLQVFNPDSGDNFELLYEILKYDITEVSPNGLYDNMYKLCFLVNRELRNQGKSQQLIDCKTSGIFTLLACNVTKFEAKEEEIKSREDRDSDDLSQAGFEVDTQKEQIRRANQKTRDLLNDVIQFNQPIGCSVAGGENLTTLQKTNILATYKIPFRFQTSEAIKLQGFSTLNVILGEFDVHFSYLAVPIDPTALGACVDAIDSLEALRELNGSVESKMSEDEYLDYKHDVLRSSSYSNCIRALSSNIYASQSTRTAVEPVNISTLELKYESLVVCKYENKGIPLAVILRNKSDKVPAFEKLLLCPLVSSIYAELAECGVKIEGLVNGVEDIKRLDKNVVINEEIRDLVKFPTPTDKKTYTVISSETPILSMVDLLHKLTTVKSSNVAIDMRSLRTPAWTRGDSEGITEGLKKLFKVI